MSGDDDAFVAEFMTHIALWNTIFTHSPSKSWLSEAARKAGRKG